jgi:hypothetical protein
VLVRDFDRDKRFEITGRRFLSHAPIVRAGLVDQPPAQPVAASVDGNAELRRHVPPELVEIVA